MKLQVMLIITHLSFRWKRVTKKIKTAYSSGVGIVIRKIMLINVST